MTTPMPNDNELRALAEIGEMLARQTAAGTMLQGEHRLAIVELRDRLNALATAAPAGGEVDAGAECEHAPMTVDWKFDSHTRTTKHCMRCGVDLLVPPTAQASDAAIRTMGDDATLQDYLDGLGTGTLTPVDQMALDNRLHDLGVHDRATPPHDTGTERGEAIGEMRDNGVTWFGPNPHAHPIGTRFYARPAMQASETPACIAHPDAPHGFNRNASHDAHRYVCDCEGWEPPHDTGTERGEAVGVAAESLRQRAADPMLRRLRDKHIDWDEFAQDAFDYFLGWPTAAHRAQASEATRPAMQASEGADSAVTDAMIDAALNCQPLVSQNKSLRFYQLLSNECDHIAVMAAALDAARATQEPSR